MKYKLTQGWPQHIESGAFVNPDNNTEYLAWRAEGNTPEPADPVPNPRIAQIKSELAANDTKIIRALAEGDATRVAAHNAAQELLRQELRGL